MKLRLLNLMKKLILNLYSNDMKTHKDLTTFQKCNIIKTLLLTTVGEILSYDSWSDDFKLKHLNEGAPEEYKIDPNDLTEEEMNQLDFGRWFKESTLRLIPIWLYPFLAEEFESTNIFGMKCFKLSEIDSDHRYGYLAYGVIPKPVEANVQDRQYLIKIKAVVELALKEYQPITACNVVLALCNEALNQKP